MPSVTPLNRYNATLTAAKADNVIEKLEGRNVRKKALEVLKKAPQKDRAKLMAGFQKTFGQLVKKAPDQVTKNYLGRVEKEMGERRTHQLAGEALMKYLAANASTLPTALKNVDRTQEFEVGATMQGGVWLRVPVTERGDFDKTTKAVEKLFATVPALKKFEPVWVLA